METRFSRVLQGQTQNRLFMSQGMLDRLERMMKRVVGRQIDQRVLTELAKIKLELIIFEGASYESMKTVTSIVLSSPDIKIVSFVKKVDQSSLGSAGRMMSDILSLGIEDLETALADNWKDVIVEARIIYAADKITPESVYLQFGGFNTHVRIYYDGVLVYDSPQNSTLGRYVTYFEKTVSLTTP